MGCRSCEKQKMNYRKGLWSPEEDHRLREYVLKHGHGCWTTVPAKAGLQRTGKSCRLRWLNYLRPGLKHGIFSEEEEEMVMKLHTKLGNKWSQIATYLPGRTDNEVKNYWNSYLKKKVNPNFATSSNFTGSDNEVLEANQFPQKTNNQISASQSFFVSSSSQSTSPSVNEGPSNTKGSNHAASLPKVIFADWLSCSNYMGDEANCQWASDSQKSEQGLLPVNKQANGEFLDGFTDNNIYGELQSQFQIEGQLQGSGLFDLLSVGEICGDLDVNHDMTF